MSWVGFAEGDPRKTVRSVAQAGFEEGYLATLDLVWADAERGRGPIGTAIRDRAPVVAQDIFAHPDFAPWRAEAAKRGYASVAALPLVTDGVAFGAIAVYSSTVGAFDEDEMRLLVELADDLAFGLRTLRLRSDHDAIQARLVQADRMVSVGTLAAGVAHEINNPLAYVISNLDHVAPGLAELAQDLPAERSGAVKRLEEALREAREGAERIRHTVGDLRTFSRTDENEFGPVELERVLDSSAAMAQNEIRHRARLVKDYGPSPAVLANAGRLGQVFLNLIVNAAHSITEGAKDRNEIHLVTRTDASGRAVVEVRDTGAGIPPEIRDRIFDPFFTTKPVGVGTGLGLYVCRNIMASLGGEIEAESEVGRGSAFRVTLPAAPPGAPAERRPAAASATGRRGRVLVVDDEPAVARAVERSLAGEHDVVAITSAREARRRILRGERFDVLVCDLMMPEMTGMELHAELVQAAPDQAARMVVMTGGAFTPAARRFLRGPVQHLDKPFDPQRMRTVVRSFVG